MDHQKAIAGVSVKRWREQYPLLNAIMALEEVLWWNPDRRSTEAVLPTLDIGRNDVDAAAARLQRFAPYLATVFPETDAAGGIIESPVREIAPECAAPVPGGEGTAPTGPLFLKCDNELPISGSIKARGGIYEVLKYAEELAVTAGLLRSDGSDDYSRLTGSTFRKLFADYSLSVGSTGNLGLSIGLMGATLGFSVTVHMSADARQWKKDLLRSRGVSVVEYRDDYSAAVAEGRRQAELDPHCHFVDDENSLDLFMGYAVAGDRVKRQLTERGVVVDAEHPLYVYLPCGVGGGPGGVAFGLKLAYGDAVHCLFAEPTHSPAMLLGLYTGLHNRISVQDLGIDNTTAADGLAVGRPSGFVGIQLQHLIDGAFTVFDETLFALLARIYRLEQISLEPSALAGMAGVARVAPMVGKNATHLVWATGGSMVPEEEMIAYRRRGEALE